MDQVKFAGEPLKNLKGYGLPQISLGPFLHTLPQM